MKLFKVLLVAVLSVLLIPAGNCESKEEVNIADGIQFTISADKNNYKVGEDGT